MNYDTKVHTGEHDSVSLVSVLHADFLQAFDKDVAVGVVRETKDPPLEFLH